MLQHVIERVRKSRLVDEVIVVTSFEKSNLPILSLCASLGIRVYVGAEEDVLDRYYQAARLLRPDYIIRVTGDCPLFDGKLLDAAIAEMSPDADYLGMLSETFADGLDIEIIRYEALHRAWKEADLRSQREHVTQYIIKNPDRFTLQDFVSPIGSFGSERWTLDEEEDYRLIRTILDHFAENNVSEFGYKEILQYLNSHPELRKINARYSRNEGLAKSLANDGRADLLEE